jgi:hypothetical protein
MLTPFLVLWPISMAIEYFIAYSVASSAYDRELKDSVVVLSRQVSFVAASGFSSACLHRR